MATVQQIVTAALRKIAVAEEDVDPSEASLSNGLDALNRMMHAWKLRGVDVTHADVALTDTFPLDPEFEEGTIYVLASRLAPDHVAPESFDADDWFRTLQAAYAVIEPATMPRALTRMPSRYWRSARIR